MLQPPSKILSVLQPPRNNVNMKFTYVLKHAFKDLEKAKIHCEFFLIHVYLGGRGHKQRPTTKTAPHSSGTRVITKTWIPRGSPSEMLALHNSPYIYNYIYATGTLLFERSVHSTGGTLEPRDWLKKKTFGSCVACEALHDISESILQSFFKIVFQTRFLQTWTPTSIQDASKLFVAYGWRLEGQLDHDNTNHLASCSQVGQKS